MKKMDPDPLYFVYLCVCECMCVCMDGWMHLCTSVHLCVCIVFACEHGDGLFDVRVLMCLCTYVCIVLFFVCMSYIFAIATNENCFCTMCKPCFVSNSLQKVEAAFERGDARNIVLVVKNDSRAPLATANGDPSFSHESCRG